MEREPIESDSMRDGSWAMVVADASSDVGVDEEEEGRMEERIPGVNVAGANTCFMVLMMLRRGAIDQEYITVYCACNKLWLQ